MADLSYVKFRNEILRSFAKFGVEYKLFGGSVVQLANETRETEDIDVMVACNLDCVKRFILALEDCGFASQQSLIEQVFGVGKKFGETPMYSTCGLYPEKEIWKANKFHIDLCFNIGQWEYSTMPEEIVERNGISIHTVSFLGVIRMKANVFPYPRPKDVEDIKFLSAYLGLDPATGEPLKSNKTKKGWWRK